MVNKWIKYVLAFQKKNNIQKYGDAMKLAGPSYRKQCGLTKKRKSPKKRSRKKSKKKRSKSRKKTA